jgi:hypothetical protein
VVERKALLVEGAGEYCALWILKNIGRVDPLVNGSDERRGTGFASYRRARDQSVVGRVLLIALLMMKADQQHRANRDAW